LLDNSFDLVAVEEPKLHVSTLQSIINRGGEMIFTYKLNKYPKWNKGGIIT
jgi:hypothetical protein